MPLRAAIACADVHEELQRREIWYLVIGAANILLNDHRASSIVVSSQTCQEAANSPMRAMSDGEIHHWWVRFVFLRGLPDDSCHGGKLPRQL